MGARSSHRMLTRTSTSVYGAPGGITLNRKRAPSRTPAGTRNLSSCVDATSPPPPQCVQRSCQLSPRPPQPRARAPKRDVERNGCAPERFLRAQDDLGIQSHDRRFAEERVAHPVEHARHGREVDSHLIREPLRAPVMVAGPLMQPQPAVVRSATVRVAQDVVRTGNLQERRAAVVPRDVRVVASGELPVRALDLVSARARRHTQNVVIVPHTLSDERPAAGQPSQLR